MRDELKTFEAFQQIPSVCFMSFEELTAELIADHYEQLKRRKRLKEYEESLKKVQIAFENYKKEIESGRQEL